MLWQEYFDFLLHVGRYGNTAILLQADNQNAKLFIEEALQRLKSFCYVYRVSRSEELSMAKLSCAVLAGLSVIEKEEDYDLNEWINKTHQLKRNVIIFIENVDELSESFLKEMFLVIKAQENKTAPIHFVLHTEKKRLHIKMKNLVHEIELPQESFCYFSLENEDKKKKKKTSKKQPILRGSKVAKKIENKNHSYKQITAMIFAAFMLSLLSVYLILPSKAQKARALDEKKAKTAISLSVDQIPFKNASIYIPQDPPELIHKIKSLSPVYHWWLALDRKMEEKNSNYYPQWVSVMKETKEIKLVAYASSDDSPIIVVQ